MQRYSLSRRRFIQLSTAAATSVVVASEPAEAMTPPGTKGGPHYRESEHVKQYYRVNRY